MHVLCGDCWVTAEKCLGCCAETAQGLDLPVLPVIYYFVMPRIPVPHLVTPHNLLHIVNYFFLMPLFLLSIWHLGQWNGSASKRAQGSSMSPEFNSGDSHGRNRESIPTIATWYTHVCSGIQVPTYIHTKYEIKRLWKDFIDLHSYFYSSYLLIWNQVWKIVL